MSSSKDKDLAVPASRTLPNNNNDVNMTNRNFEFNYSREHCDQEIPRLNSKIVSTKRRNSEPVSSTDMCARFVTDDEDLDTYLARVFSMVDKDRTGLVHIQTLLDYLATLVDLPRVEKWKFEELRELLDPDGDRRFVDIDLWRRAGQAWLDLIRNDENSTASFADAVLDLPENLNETEVAAGANFKIIEGVGGGGTKCCTNREVELESKVSELNYQVLRLMEDKRELERNLAASEDFGQSLTCLTTELEGSHRRLSMSLSNSITKGELLLEEAIQVKEAEESQTEKVEHLTKELHIKEKDLMKKDELLKMLTVEVAQCKEKEDLLGRQLDEERLKCYRLKEEIERKNENITQEVYSREKVEVLLEKARCDLGVLEEKLSEKEEELKNLRVKGSRSSSQKSSYGDPLIHDVSVDDKVFEENIKAHRSTACVFDPSKVPLYSPISALRRGPSASSTPNKSKLDSIADELKESKRESYQSSFSFQVGCDERKEVMKAVEKLGECAMRILVDQVPGQSNKVMIILNKEVQSAKKSIECVMDEMPSKKVFLEMKEKVASLELKLLDREAMVDKLKINSEKNCNLVSNENEATKLSTRVSAITSLLKAANNSALLAVTHEGSITIPNYSLENADTDLSNWQLDLEGIQFTEYSAELSKKLIQSTVNGMKNNISDRSQSLISPTPVHECSSQVLSATLWQNVYIKLEELHKESEVSSYIMMMAEESMKEKSINLSSSVHNTKPDSTSILCTKSSSLITSKVKTSSTNQASRKAESTQGRSEPGEVSPKSLGRYQPTVSNQWSKLLAFSTKQVRRAAEGIPIPGASMLWQSLYTKMEKPHQEPEIHALRVYNSIGQGENENPTQSKMTYQADNQITTFNTLVTNIIPRHRPNIHMSYISNNAAVQVPKPTDKTKESENVKECIGNAKDYPDRADPDDSDSLIRRVEQNVKVLENKILLLEGKKHKLEKELIESRSCIAEKSKAYDKLGRELALSVSERSVLEIRIKCLDAELYTKGSRISELEENLNDHHSQLSQLKEALADKSSEAGILETRCIDSDNLIKMLEVEVNCLKAQVENFDDRIDKLKADLEVKDKIIVEKNVEIDRQLQQTKDLNTKMKFFETSSQESDKSFQRVTLHDKYRDNEDQGIKNVQLEEINPKCRQCKYFEYKLKIQESEKEVLLKMNFDLGFNITKGSELSNRIDDGKETRNETEVIEKDFILVESILKATKERLNKRRKQEAVE